MTGASQVADLMDRMLKVDVFQASEKLRLTRDSENTFLDPNLIMDARHRILREDLSVSPTKSSVLSEAKRLLAQEEETQSFMKKQQRFLERELRRFETEVLRSRPKFSGPYTCKRRTSFAASDDEQFWEACKRTRLKRIASEGSTERSSSLEGTMESMETRGCSSKRNEGPETTERELSLVGSIKVMITDKPSCETEPQRRLGALRRCFDALRLNAEEERRLREIRTKIQVGATLRLTRKYFDAWRTHARTSKRPTEESEASDEQKIELFISAIVERQRELARNRKPRSREDGKAAREVAGTVSKMKNVVSRSFAVESPAQNRLIAQKRIIEDQRAKLAEQNRIIEELKLKEARKEIYKAGKETVDAAKETLTLCGKMTRRTLVQLMLQAGYRDESLTVPCRAPDPPKFLSRMEARAEARRERMKLVEEFRRTRLEERKRQEEAARAEEEQAKKRLQQEAAAEARRLRREQEQNRLREIERQRRLNNVADQFYRRYLLRRYLIDPLTNLVEQKKSNARKADDWYRRNTVGRMFTVWRRLTETERESRIAIAESFRRRCLIASVFEEWKRVAKEVNSRHQVAADFCDMKLLDRYFGSWRAVTLELKAERKRNEELADDRYRQCLRARYFNVWRKYRAIAADIAETEKRKEELRQLVQTVIPDFDPRPRGVALED